MEDGTLPFCTTHRKTYCSSCISRASFMPASKFVRKRPDGQRPRDGHSERKPSIKFYHSINGQICSFPEKTGIKQKNNPYRPPGLLIAAALLLSIRVRAGTGCARRSQSAWPSTVSVPAHATRLQQSIQATRTHHTSHRCKVGLGNRAP